jgi:hypothetical protein
MRISFLTILGAVGVIATIVLLALGNWHAALAGILVVTSAFAAGLRGSGSEGSSDYSDAQTSGLSRLRGRRK